ncbi:hypothetical protein [Paludibacter jiangxiensis]|uniref:Uncharacterized protein n=1 Tax=Paludibacter jiangxiensis TaxID=681398 RepID=A0A161L837_9BACT|nr:hypothetical protein [Paludibacter jiangxiensis]GAT63144.1 hypothetical protein PJIAN_3458 [Paludibacter jiangxiensis]
MTHKSIALLVSLMFYFVVFAQQQSISTSKPTQYEIKKLCLEATKTAIQLEIANYQRWIDVRKQQNAPAEAAEFQKTLDSLKIELETYQKMPIDKYTLPEGKQAPQDFFSQNFARERITTTAWVESNAQNNTILHVEGMSKSGPWYHLVGILGNDYTQLKPNTKYRITFYTVYKRNYWNMPSAYVCITSIQK